MISEQTLKPSPLSSGPRPCSGPASQRGSGLTPVSTIVDPLAEPTASHIPASTIAARAAVPVASRRGRGARAFTRWCAIVAAGASVEAEMGADRRGVGPLRRGKRGRKGGGEHGGARADQALELGHRGGP